MTEHESNLHDLYAGLAMLGLLVKGEHTVYALTSMAYNIADNMLAARKESLNEDQQPEGIVSVMAFSEVEERKNAYAKAAKKAKARTKAV